MKCADEAAAADVRILCVQRSSSAVGRRRRRRRRRIVMGEKQLTAERGTGARGGWLEAVVLFIETGEFNISFCNLPRHVVAVAISLAVYNIIYTYIYIMLDAFVRAYNNNSSSSSSNNIIHGRFPILLRRLPRTSTETIRVYIFIYINVYTSPDANLIHILNVSYSLNGFLVIIASALCITRCVCVRVWLYPFITTAVTLRAQRGEHHPRVYNNVSQNARAPK